MCSEESNNHDTMIVNILSESIHTCVFVIQSDGMHINSAFISDYRLQVIDSNLF